VRKPADPATPLNPPVVPTGWFFPRSNACFNNYPTEKTIIKLGEIPGRLEVLNRGEH